MTTQGYWYDDWISGLTQSPQGTGNDVRFTPTWSPAFQMAGQGVSNDAYVFHPDPLSKSYTTNGLNQYASVGGVNFGHDTRGNLTSGATRSFTYDLENHLLSASAPTAVTLGYDPLGRLQTSTAGGATTTLLYDGSLLAGEYDATNALVNRYVPGPDEDEPLVWYVGAGTGQRQWLLPDTQGSIIAWADGTGTLVGSQAYDPYGGPSTWASGSRYAYTGQLMIPEAKLYSYKARMYDPSFGRFLQTDPVGYASDVNLYAYAGNDPVNGSDPSGLAEPDQNFEGYCPAGGGGSPEQCWGYDPSSGVGSGEGTGVGFWNFGGGRGFGGGGGGGGGQGAGPKRIQNSRACNSGRGLTGGAGVVFGGNATLGAALAGVAATGQVGAGGFLNGGRPSGGGFASGGAAASFLGQGWGRPAQTAGSASAGAFIGGGAGVFVTNAASANRLSGPFTTYNIDAGYLIGLSASLSVDGNGTWFVSVSGGPGAGLGVQMLKTTTASIGGCR